MLWKSILKLLIVRVWNRFPWWKLIHPVLGDRHDFPMGLIVCYPPERGRHRVISDGRKQQGWPEATHGDVTRCCTTRRSFINVQRSTTERIVRCFIISFGLDRWLSFTIRAIRGIFEELLLFRYFHSTFSLQASGFNFLNFYNSAELRTRIFCNIFNLRRDHSGSRFFFFLRKF